MKSGQPELKRSDLTFGRFDVVHEPTSDRFRVYKGKVDTVARRTRSSAFFYDQAGAVVVPRAPAR